MKQPRKPFPVVEVVVAVLAFGALAAAAFFNAHQDQAIHGRIDTLSTYDAASGGYRAWFELLQREGVRVARFERRPAFLDRSVDVYVFASDVDDEIAQAQYGKQVDVMNGGDWDALARWIKDGGHFVWLADGRTYPQYLNAPRVSEVGPAHDDALALAPTQLSAGVRAVSGTSELRVPFAEAGAAAPVVGDDTGGVVVSYPLGRGAVTVVSDESLFQNARLSSADNARLAYDLATTGLTPHGSVAFDEWSHGYAAGDTWWTILPRQFQVAFILAAAALLLFAIGTALRFGPAARLPDESERTSAEYLTSMALLYERGRAVRATIGELAGACIRDLAAALGLPESAPARTIAASAGGADGDDRGEAIMQLDRLRSFEYPHAADLVRAATLCASLRKEFIRHGRIGIGRRSSSARRSA